MSSKEVKKLAFVRFFKVVPLVNHIRKEAHFLSDEHQKLKQIIGSILNEPTLV